MSSRLWRIVWGRLRSDWPFLLACWLLVATAVTLVTAGALYADTVELGGVHRALAEADPATRGVDLQLTASPADEAALDASVRLVMDNAFAATGADVAMFARSTALVPALDGLPGLDPGRPAMAQLVVLGAYQDLDAHAALSAGRWPVGGQQPIEAALSDAAAAALGLQVGDRLQLADAATAGADPAAVVADITVVGTWRPDSIDDPYWLGDALDLAGSAGRQAITRGPVVVDPSDLLATAASGQLALEWRARPIVAALTTANVEQLRAGIAAIPDQLKSALPAAETFRSDVKLADVLGSIDRSATVSRSGVILVILQFAVLAAYAVLLAGALLAERRRPEVALLRARGARGRQIGAIAASEALALALPATLVAPLVALALIGFIGSYGAVGEAGILSTPALSLTELAAAALAGLACVLALSLPALLADIDLAHVRAAVGRPLGRTLAQRIGLDLVLGAVTLIGLFQLQAYGSPVALGSGGSVTIDPALVAAPVLSLLAGALLVIRIVPRIGELAEVVFSRRRGLLVALAARQVARRPLRYTRTALLIVLASALATFAAAYSATWSRSQADQAAYTTGADMVVPAGTQRLASNGAAGALQAVAGVRASQPVARIQLDVGRVAQNADALVLDGGQMAGLLAGSAESAQTSAALAQLGTGPADFAGLDLPADTRRLAVVMHLDLKPAPNDFGVTTLVPFPGQGIEATLVVRLADDTIARLKTLVGAFQDPAAYAAVTLPEAAGTAVAPRLLSVQIQAHTPLPLVGDITIQRIDVSSAAASDVWATVAPVDQLSSWSFGAASPGAALQFDSRNPLHVTDELGSDQRPQVFLWQPPANSSDSLPIVASTTFAARTGAGVGDPLNLTYHSAQFPATIVAVLPSFPSLDPQKPFVLIGGGGFRVMANSLGLADPAPTEWWVWTQPGASDQVAATLSAPPWSATGVISEQHLRQSLERDPVALGLVGALALGSLAAAVCAAIGLIVGAVVATRERLAETALLRALGLTRRGVAAGVMIDNGYLIGFGLPAGLGLGILLSWLVLPHTPFNRTGAPVVPPPTIVVPAELLIGLVVAGLALLVITGLIAGRAATSVAVAEGLRTGGDLT